MSWNTQQAPAVFAAAARIARADMSVPVIATAIETSMLRGQRVTSMTSGEPREKNRPRPLVSELHPLGQRPVDDQIGAAREA